MSYVVVMNCATTGISEYALGWLDVIEHDSGVQGLAPSGVETLASDGTGVVAGRISTGDIDFATLLEKTVPRWYGEVQLGKDAALTVVAKGLGSELPQDYPLAVVSELGSLNPTQRRERLSRGDRGVWWQFIMAGADFLLGTQEVLAVPTSERG